MQVFVDKLVSELNSSQKVNKIEVHTFDSGAYMIDIWLEKSFYCIQLYDQKLGYSRINDEVNFSTIPDHIFDTYDEFTSHFFDEINRGDR